MRVTSLTHSGPVQRPRNSPRRRCQGSNQDRERQQLQRHTWTRSRGPHKYNAGKLQKISLALPLGGGIVTTTIAHNGYGDVDKVTNTTGASTKYDYDAFDRLTKTTPSVGNTVTNSYDGLDRLDFKCTSPLGDGNCSAGTRLQKSYVGLTSALSQETDNNNRQRTYDYDSQLEPLGQDRFTIGQETTAAGHSMRVFAADANGSIEGLEQPDGTMPTGANGSAYTYDPYGEQTNTDSTLSTDAANNPIRFEGFAYDTNTQLYDMGARTYRPGYGQFLTPDRYESASGDQTLMSSAGTSSRYAFGGGDPVGHVEFDGHRADTNPFTNTDGSVNTRGRPQQAGGGRTSATAAYNNHVATQRQAVTQRSGPSDAAQSSNFDSPTRSTEQTPNGRHPSRISLEGHPYRLIADDDRYVRADKDRSIYEETGIIPAGAEIVSSSGPGGAGLPRGSTAIIDSEGCPKTAAGEALCFAVGLAIPAADGVSAGRAAASGVRASARLGGGAAAKEVRTFRAGEDAGGGGISLGQAADAAERNGINMRMFDLRHEPGDGAFGFMSQTGSGALSRGPTGRILLTLKDPALASERDAVETIAHELNHVRGVLGSGAVTNEATAEAAAQAAGRHLRP